MVLMDLLDVGCHPFQQRRGRVAAVIVESLEPLWACDRKVAANAPARHRVFIGYSITRSNNSRLTSNVKIAAYSEISTTARLLALSLSI
jgi:hypothetical protein